MNDIWQIWVGWFYEQEFVKATSPPHHFIAVAVSCSKWCHQSKMGWDILALFLFNESKQRHVHQLYQNQSYERECLMMQVIWLGKLGRGILYNLLCYIS